MSDEPSYAIGVDLGTTHCALSYVDLDLSEGDEVAQHTLPVPQLTAPGEIEAQSLLPSFLYLPHATEFGEGELSLPWPTERTELLGELARTRGGLTSIRLVSSAKSWLCHPGVDRRAPILPPEAPEEVPRVSPLEASARYLTHLREAWDQKHPDAPLRSQPVVLTVPASFDPAARELTAEAARSAGFEQLTLLEEPQAAMYSWVSSSAGGWREDVQVGDVLLVIDVGGGTTDFSLIAVEDDGGSLSLRRIAVGDHILLGGDNMDLTLAHVVRMKLEQAGKKLDDWQMRSLTLGCRGAKEQLLTDSDVDAVPLVVPSRGRKLIGGSIRTELTRDEVRQVLLEGFFPVVGADARPKGRARAALTKLGLPYTQDPAITRHLAAFLSKQAGAVSDGEGFVRPTALLFNGGVFKSPILVERIREVVDGWLEHAGAEPARMIEGTDLDQACARGAAYYAYSTKRGGVRIRGGTAKSFYIGVEAAMPAVPGMEPPLTALCVAPFGMEEGTDAGSPDQEFGLVVGESVKFRFFGSSVRRDDAVGTALDRWDDDELEELNELEAELQAEGRQPGDVVPVRLEARVTEVGTLELLAISRAGDARWKVEFDVRGDAG
ncbi:MAG: Hsp70 family protein [Myxococcota bacterium]